MRQDEFGAALEAALREADEPMTASELRDAVGCSRQRVYTWLQSHEARLRVVSKDRSGGQRYAWVEDEGSSIEDVFHVKSFFVDSGAVVLVLVGPDGSTYHARPA